MPAAAIELDGVAKYFGAVVGIDDVTLRIDRGEVFGFLGANGAGKTTTIRLLLDLLRPSRGRASVLGFDCHRQSFDARRQIGYLPGDLPIYPDLTGADFLQYLASIDPRPVSPNYLRGLLRRFDVSDVDLTRPLREQSHGMKQKLGIVQALMTRPPVVVLDEPTAGLDPFMVHAFRDVLDELRSAGDTTIFLSSHVLTEVELTCDRVGVIRSGRMVHVSSIADLKQRAPRRVTVTFSHPVPAPWERGVVVHATTPVRWDVEVEGPLGPFLQALGGLPVADVEVEPFSLERQVLRLYGTAEAERTVDV